MQCVGSENELKKCGKERAIGDCKSAGVTCRQSSSKPQLYHYCKGIILFQTHSDVAVMSTQHLMKDLGLSYSQVLYLLKSCHLLYLHSFGHCEPYKTKADICADTLTPGTDFVYISNKLPGNQSVTSTLLNEKFKKARQLLFSKDHHNCVEMVLHIACHYYLPPCGNSIQYLTPSSLCQEECEYIKSACPSTWHIASLAFDFPLSFISCNDTSRLLHPLPNCCGGAGIELPQKSSQF